jgi:hypothetical protein
VAPRDLHGADKRSAFAYASAFWLVERRRRMRPVYGDGAAAGTTLVVLAIGSVADTFARLRVAHHRHPDGVIVGHASSSHYSSDRNAQQLQP